MGPPGRRPEVRALARLGARAQVAATTTRREYAYRWTVRRSPAFRVLAAPLLLAAGLILLLVGVLVLALMLVTTVLVVVAFAATTVLWPIRARLARGHRRI